MKQAVKNEYYSPIMREKIQQIQTTINESDYNTASALTAELHRKALLDDDYLVIGQSLLFYATIEAGKGFAKPAMVKLKSAEGLCREHNFIYLLLDVLNVQGNIFSFLVEYQKAMECYIEILRLCDRHNIRYRMNKALNNLGNLSMMTHEYNSALEHLLASVEISKKENDKTTLLISHSNLAEVYIAKKDFEKAKIHNRKSVEIAEKLKDNVGVACAMSNEAIILCERDKNWNVARTMFESAIKILDKMEVKADVYDIRIKFAEQAYKFKHFIFALDLLESIIQEVVKYEYRSFEKGAMEILEKVYAGMNNYRKAYEIAVKIREIQERAFHDWQDSSFELVETDRIINSSTSEIVDLQHSIKTLKLLSSIGQKITACQTKTDVYRTLYANISNFFDIDTVAVVLVSEKEDELNFVVENEKGFREYAQSASNSDSLMAYSIRENKELFVPDTELYDFTKTEFNKEIQLKFESASVRSLIVCPLFYEDKVIGGITIQSETPNCFSLTDVETLRVISSYTSIALVNLERQSELIKMNKELERISRIDGLTRVHNRFALTEYMNSTFLTDVQRKGPIAAMMIDIDYFKQYNDTYGHVKGDKCLIEVSRIIKRNLEGTDYDLYRYGGDEFFAIILHSDKNSVKTILEKLKKDIQKQKIENINSKASKFVTLSIGVAMLYNPVASYTEVFSKSDEALYDVKENGRNGYNIIKM